MSKRDELTYGYTVLTERIKPHMVCADRQCRDITMKRPRGKRTYYLVIQETLDGRYCSHGMA